MSSPPETSPKLIVIAGPNGAGKSTLYTSLLSEKGLPFVNANHLAKDLKLSAYEAASLAGEIRERFLRAGKSFIFETVFSDPVGDKVSFMQKAVELGWEVTLFYIGIDSPQQSGDRVASRVSAGGHDVPSEKLEGRYTRSLENLKRAIQVLPRVLVYDNSSRKTPHRLVAEFRKGEPYKISEQDPPHWLPPT